MSELEIKIEALCRCVPQDAFEKALAEVSGESKTEAPPLNLIDLEQEIRDALRDLAVPAHIKGYGYLISAIGLAVKDPGLIDAITGELYPAVAANFQTTPSRVERAIRHAIEVGWVRGDLDVTYRYFGNTVSPSKGKPTNSEFIAQLSDVFRQRIKKSH